MFVLPARSSGHHRLEDSVMMGVLKLYVVTNIVLFAD